MRSPNLQRSCAVPTWGRLAAALFDQLATISVAALSLGALSLGALSLGALSLGTGCGAAFDGRTYRGKGFSFTVPAPPAKWEMLRVKDSALTFDDPSTGAMIAVNGRCDKDGEDVPLRSLTRHLFLQFKPVDVLTEEVQPFDGREAMRSDVATKLDGVERRLVVWVMKKDKCVYDLWYIARPDKFTSGVAEFDAWAKGFTARRDP